MSTASSVPAVAAKPYVEIRNGGYYVINTRVSLDSVVYQFQEGQPPENILRSFPALGTLENVYGAIAFYLANRSDATPQSLQKNAPELYAKLMAAKRTHQLKSH